MAAPTRVVHQGDALAWLAAQSVLTGASFITSLPDASELPHLAHAAWEAWFVAAARLVLSRVSSDGLAIFYQTDVKTKGRWIDKAQLVARAAEAAGAVLVFHKLVLRAPAGAVTRGRPAYSHLVAWSPNAGARGARNALGDATADVLPGPGATTWTRGMGVEACRVACESVLRFTPTRTIVDPFCGHGTVLAVANALGLDAVGVELGVRRARRARTLKLEALVDDRRKGRDDGAGDAQ